MERLITQPHPEQAATMVALRARLLQEELMLCGVQSAVAERHTAGWTTPESVADYQNIVETWLRDPYMFVRTVQTPSPQGMRITGLFVAEIANEEEPSHYVRSIQLDPSIRRQGIGRQLFQSFAHEAGVGLPIELDVFEHNPHARSFYRQLGFVSLNQYDTLLVDGSYLLTMMRLQVEGSLL